MQIYDWAGALPEILTVKDRSFQKKHANDLMACVLCSSEEEASWSSMTLLCRQSVSIISNRCIHIMRIRSMQSI